MKLNINNVPQDNILIFDIEYDQNVLIQLATLTLCKIESDVFQLTRSTNIYIDPNQSVSSFFMGYTNITNDYLRHNGTDLAGARSLAHEVVFDVGTNNTLLVSHGLDNDLDILYVFTCKDYEVKGGLTNLPQEIINELEEEEYKNDLSNRWEGDE